MSTATIYFARQTENTSSHEWLYHAAKQHFGLTKAQLGELSATANGKPFFSLRQELCFSISHSGDYWMCAFSDVPVGLDVQQHQPRIPPQRLSRRFFHPREDAYLAQAGYNPFFDLWCAKESWVKYTGRGFHDLPDRFSVVSEDGRFPAMDGVCLRLLPFAQGYSLCLCTEKTCEIRFVSLKSSNEEEMA